MMQMDVTEVVCNISSSVRLPVPFMIATWCHWLLLFSCRFLRLLMREMGQIMLKSFMDDIIYVSNQSGEKKGYSVLP